MTLLRRSLISFCAVTLAGTASAADISLISGLYKKQDDKVADKNAGSSQVIEAGGRYGAMISGNLGFFGQGMLSLKSYNAPSGSPDPDDSTSLEAGGGVRFIGKRWNEVAIPYIWGMGLYKSVKDAEIATATQTESNGLYYRGGVGMRLSIDADFFVDLESSFFESALFATEKKTTTTVDATGKETKVESKRSKTELYGTSWGGLGAMVVGLGMKL